MTVFPAQNNPEQHGGLALDGYPSNSATGEVEITQNGFEVSGYCNTNNEVYYYMAIKSGATVTVH